MIEKAAWFFADDLGESEKKKIATGLKLLKTGMSHEILQFGGECRECKGANANDPGLTIRGCESAFSSNISVAFLIAKLENSMFQRVVLCTKKGARGGNSCATKFIKMIGS